ncbi:DNA polymerase domain-containing protein [Leptospira sp. GIMC2001]|uniref:DNA polymerase domain-containing protein n=1 Tax=Leptospira sp. GIMC2001 TaxID=1513297 RepID=UPI0004A5C60E|nr:DNA polymerase domain-containing protein [Leptospira sp. GIMC2001]AID56285.1 archaeal DNA polymerase I [Leptospira sp. GIMC2001]WCL50452.1 DNA polymerase [Leptospira sp. GIMC2001]
MVASFEGILFDLYDLEGNITLWIQGEDELRCFQDVYYPSFYISGSEAYEKKFIARLIELNSLRSRPKRVDKLDFYKNEIRSVLEIHLSRPSVLKRIYQKLYAFYEKLDIYHSDIDITTSYLYSKGLFPLAKVRVLHEGSRIKEIVSLTNIQDYEYTVPNFRILQLSFKTNHRIGYSKSNPLVFSNSQGYNEEVFRPDPRDLLGRINEILREKDPDIILSSFGDQAIFPFLFQMSQSYGIKLLFDRDPYAITRKIQTLGTSFESYGQTIYRAPNYPLFGRLHIDVSNSFVYKESFINGVIELARLSRIPIQKMARSSTGTALTNIEMDVALRKNYLVPWQKSALERPKSAYELIRVDKGGLVCLPDTSYGSLLQNVTQLDFAQMYPSIMANYNISPETVNCPCCTVEEAEFLIPGTSFHVCAKRRGVVSEALDKLLVRRKYYKEQIERKSPNAEIYEARQNSLKWMFVTSFGYLGYRNAKFGRIESHEAVTAIGREVLLLAKEMAEDAGYTFLHAITDSIFIVKPNEEKFSKEELSTLCKNIGERTKIQLKVEGIYDWLVFPASKIDSKIGVVNRYLGKFASGELKIRGIFLRRKDIPNFVKNFQADVLEIMGTCSTKDELIAKRDLIDTVYHHYENELQSNRVALADLFLKRTITKSPDKYKANNSSTISLAALLDENITVQAGEKIKYLVLQGYRKKREYIPEEVALRLADTRSLSIHKEFYRDMLVQALEEVTEHLFTWQYFRSLRERQHLLPFVTELLC